MGYVAVGLLTLSSLLLLACAVVLGYLTQRYWPWSEYSLGLDQHLRTNSDVSFVGLHANNGVVTQNNTSSELSDTHVATLSYLRTTTANVLATVDNLYLTKSQLIDDIFPFSGVPKTHSNNYVREVFSGTKVYIILDTLPGNWYRATFLFDQEYWHLMPDVDLLEPSATIMVNDVEDGFINLKTVRSGGVNFTRPIPYTTRWYQALGTTLPVIIEASTTPVVWCGQIIEVM